MASHTDKQRQRRLRETYTQRDTERHRATQRTTETQRHIPTHTDANIQHPQTPTHSR